MEFNEQFRNYKIDFTDCLIQLDCADEVNWDFDITPEDFLRYSKIDFREKNDRSIVNSITNAKRAIDCQIDKIFKSFGFEYDNFPTYLNEFCDFFLKNNKNKDLSIKLKIIKAFGLAPTKLVSDVRKLRNKLEHNYKLPTIEEVEDAIEIAELFLLATENKLKNIWSFEITDHKHSNKVQEGFFSGISIHKDFFKNSFSISYVPLEKEPIVVKPEDKVYAAFLRMSIFVEDEEEFLFSLKYLLSLVNHKMPFERINIGYK